MILPESPRRTSQTDRPEDAGTSEIDPDTGEILSAPHTPGSQHGPRHTAAENTTIQGERTIPSVNRERSMQSRVSGSLALATIVLLGTGFLFWYYNTQYTKTRNAEEATRKANTDRAGGEMKVPPLGRVAVPEVPSAPATNTTTPASPPPSPTNAAGTSAPQKTPEQNALERQLGMPVLRRAQTPQQTSIATSQASMESAMSPSSVAAMAQPIGALQPPAAGSTTSGGSGLAASLRPTSTLAVAAQTLPTRRLLLPKGAFIDCTLETAIDSSYEGMATCVGSSDIYGADGRIVLLERGTKYVGEQRGIPRQGQGRVFVLWNEARTPTGVVVQLASPGTDELGRNGLPGFVDTHFWDRFGAALLISVIDGTMQAVAARRQSGTVIGGGPAFVLGPQGGRDVITEVLRSTVSIPPTVIKNQGERIQILVARDVDFRSVYALRTDSAVP